MNIRSRGLTYAGVVCIIAGFGMIAYVWGRVAALTSVPLQLPYVVSGGFAALGLILVGILLVNIQTKLADATRRDRQIQQLGEVLGQIRAAVLDEPGTSADPGTTEWPRDTVPGGPDDTDAPAPEAPAADPAGSESSSSDTPNVDAPASDDTPSSGDATTKIPVVRVRSKRRRS